MPSTYTVNLGIEKPATGEQSGTWGDTVNDNSNILDEAINGVVSITLASAGSSGSPNSITITNGALSTGRNKWIEFTDGGDLGAAAYVQLTPNDAEKICFIRNSLTASRSIFLFQGTYNASNDLEIAAGTDVVVKFNGGGTGATVVNVYANLKVDGIVATTADINGGTVDGTVIGGAAAAALTATTVVANTSLNIAGTTTISSVLDEDNMASDSATALATQQSIKAYVDSQVGTVDTLSEILANGNTTGANDIDVDAAQKVQFRDAAIYINSSVDGQLDIVADTEIQIAATTIDINGAINASGEIIAASLDISGNVDIDGITNLDVVDIDGAVQIDAAVTVGIDDTGYDVKFYGATGGAYMLWDESADDLILAGAGGLVVAGNVDFNGDLDVDGTTNLDVVDIDGAVDMASTLTVAGGGGSYGINLIPSDVAQGGKLHLSTGQTANTNARNWALINSYAAYGDLVLRVSNALGGNPSTSGTSVYSALNNGTQFWSVGGSEQMRLTATGLGIGTGTPDAQGGNQSTIFNLEGSDNIVYFSGGSGGNAIDDGLAIEGVATGVTSGDKRTGSILMTRANTSTTSLDSKITFYTTSSGTHASKMTLDASGNLGLGVVPNAWGSGFTALQVENASLWSTGSDASLTANAYYDGSNYKYIASSGASRQYHNTDGSITWSQASSGTAGNTVSFTQAMTLDASGNLLVGHTSAEGDSSGTTLYQNGQTVHKADGSYALELVRSTSDGEIVRFRKDGATVGSIGAANGNLYLGQGDTTIMFSASADAVLPKGTDGADRDGFINLGQNINRFKDLHLSGGINLNTASTADTITMARGTNGQNNMMKFSTGGTDDWIVGQRNDGTSDFRFYSYGTSSDAVSITRTGNLLVGTTTSPAGSGGVSLTNKLTVGYQGVLNGFGAENVSGLFYSGGASGGYVAINSDSGNSPLYISLTSSATSSNLITFSDSGTAAGSIGTLGGNLFIGSPNGTAAHLRLGEGGIFPSDSGGFNRNAAIDLGGISSNFKDLYLSGTLNGISTTKSASGNRWGILPEVESNGVMEIGRYIDFHSTDGDTSDYGARLDYDGTNIVSTNAFSMPSGIYLGGSVAANLLNDYEEGTWTPTLESTGQIGSFTYTTQTGYYTKIGRVVNVILRISWSAIPSTGAAFKVTGLPFIYSSATDANAASVSIGSSSGVPNTDGLYGILTTDGGGSRSAIEFYSDGATAIDVTTGNNISASGTIKLSLTYIV
jgi:cytoskeletal protein CcmA (bactofilin family)